MENWLRNANKKKHSANNYLQNIQDLIFIIPQINNTDNNPGDSHKKKRINLFALSDNSGFWIIWESRKNIESLPIISPVKVKELAFVNIILFVGCQMYCIKFF